MSSRPGGRNVVLALTHLASLSPECNGELLKSLVANVNPEELEWVAYVDSLSDEMFHTLASSKVAKVRVAVAANRSCPMTVLLTLSKDSAVTVSRAALLSMKGFGGRPEVKRGAVTEDDLMVEFELCEDPKKIENFCSNGVGALYGDSFLERLISYPRIKEVTGRSIYNYVTSLAESSAVLARFAGLLSNEQIGDVLYDSSLYGRKALSAEEIDLAFTGRVDAEFIRELSNSEVGYLRAVAAGSVLIDAATIDRLATEDNAGSVVAAARRNPKINREALLASCLRDGLHPYKGDVAEYVAKYGSGFLDDLIDGGCAVAIEYAMSNKVSTSKYSLKAIIDIVAKSKDDKVRVLAVTMAEIDPGTLAKLFYDSSDKIATEALAHKSARVADLIAYSLKRKLSWLRFVGFSDEELLRVGAESIFNALNAGNLNGDGTGTITTGSILRGRITKLIFERIKASNLDRVEVVSLLIGLAEGYEGSIGDLLENVTSLTQ